jgi:Ras-related protein Rab-5C
MTPHSSFTKGKVIFVGDTNVGKTFIISSYQSRTTTPTRSTVANQAINLKVNIGGQSVNLEVFDTAGQETFRNLVPIYARGAQVAVIVYGEDARDSFENVSEWIGFLHNNADIPHILLVGNKLDLQGKIQMKESDEFAEKKKLTLIRTSALTGENIDNLFIAIAGLVESGTSRRESETEPINIENGESGGGCC